MSWYLVNPIESGPPGPPGIDGRDGAPGRDGVDGRGIAASAVTYAISNSGTAVPASGWATSIPATTATNPYLWTRIILTYTDGGTNTFYSVSRRGDDGAQGTAGTNGTNGTNGAAGADGAEGLNIWTTASQISTTAGSTQTGVAKVDVTGRTIKIGDLAISSNANSLGYYGRVTAVSSQSSVTVATVASIRGAQGTAGTNGTNGTNGAAGANGRSIYAFTAAIAYATFQTYAIGDLMVNTSTGALNIGTNTSANTSAAAGAVYEKTGANAVTARGNLRGPAGADGSDAAGVSQRANLASTTAANSVTATSIGVTGTLPIANGGTGAVNALAASENIFPNYDMIDTLAGWSSGQSRRRSANNFITDYKLQVSASGILSGDVTGANRVGQGDSKPLLIRWTITGSNQVLYIDPKNYREGEIVFVKIALSGNGVIGGSGIKSYISSSSVNNINIPSCASIRPLVMLIKGSTHLEFAAGIYASFEPS
jgi:hypothetical protein